jgi:ABC-type Fe3+/spermidine/putrescine transport system ATPase subunit
VARDEGAIRLAGLCKSFGAQRVLDHLDLDVARGELRVVLGPSGCGKSTLLRLVAGLETPDAGAVHLHGQDVTALPPHRRGLGVVMQHPSLFEHMSVEDNVGFGLRVRGASQRQAQEAVDEMLELVGLPDRRHHLPRQLSGGQRQRVAVARALAYRPSALLLDEPFSALDAVTRSELRREIRLLLRARGLAALFVTHDQEEALEMGDSIAVLHDGRIEQTGTPYEVYNQPRTEFVAAFLGAANILLGRWHESHVAIGGRSLDAPPDVPYLEPFQPVKVVFRPEDAVLGFQPQFLGVPHVLGRGQVDAVSYAGPVERVRVSLELWPAPGAPSILITRSKWEASEMELSPGDPVVVGLKSFRVLPHYPLRGESGAKTLPIA